MGPIRVLKHVCTCTYLYARVCKYIDEEINSEEVSVDKAKEIQEEEGDGT